MPEPLLRTEQLTKRFGGLTAVNNVDFALEPGVIAALIGPNGAGKTTFFNLVAGAYAPTSGAIWFGGQRIDGKRHHQFAALGIARTFQNIRLFGGMTVLENVLVGMHPHMHQSPFGALLRLPSMMSEERAAEAAARQLLGMLGLSGMEDDTAGALPYGLQRRLELARALAGRPTLLLLDEPAAGLNPAETADLTRLIQELRRSFDLTVLLIEHDVHMVMSIADRVTVFDRGERIAEGTPDQVRQDPAVIAAYLGPAFDQDSLRAALREDVR
ncbi:MAG: ABC transporter ATP-binding protein [Chloroflexi bacterium]|nr:ABC transporter ATP-binding protein [Chloroflexota bacterium]